MHRHSVRFMASRICASVGLGFLSSRTLAVMIWPFWQKPHCGTCSSTQACCSGCSLPSLASPSRVVISPFTAEAGVMQDRTAAPFIITVHSPHWPRPQPNRGPCNPRSLRRMYSKGVEGSTSNACILPFTFNVRLLMTDSILPDGMLLGYRRSQATPGWCLRTDLTDVVPPQIPAGCVTEVRQQCVDASLHHRRADGIFQLVKVIHLGV